MVMVSKRGESEVRPFSLMSGVGCCSFCDVAGTGTGCFGRWGTRLRKAGTPCT